MTEANEGTSAPHAESNGRVFLGQIEYVYGDRTSPREVLPLLYARRIRACSR
jgi:hypothetical protein